MEKELLEKLNETRENLDIPKEDYKEIVLAAMRRRKNSTSHISDELLYEIILTALAEYDHNFDEDDLINPRKSSEALVERATRSLGL